MGFRERTPSQRFVLLGFASVGAGIVATTCFALIETGTLEEKARSTVDHTLNSIRLLGRLETAVERRHNLIHEHILAAKPVETAIVESRLRSAQAEIVESQRAFAPLARELADPLAWEQTSAALAALELPVTRALQLSRQGRDREAGEIVRRLDGPFARLDAHFGQLAYINGVSASASLARLAAIRRRLFFMLLGIGTATLAGTLLVGGWATRRVARREAETDLETRILAERNRNLDAFAGHVAHDLRNEVAVISFASAQLRGKVPPGEPALDQLRHGVQGMNEIVGDLLTLARADAPVPGPCDPAGVAAEIEDHLGPRIQEAGGTLSVAVEPAELWCSHGLLRRALVNLAENALKYRRSGVPPEVDITGGPVVGEGAYILRVRDNGVGVAAEDRARIFEPFYRASGTGDIGGTGLGLAIVKRVIESSGGRLWVEPNPADGSTFVLYLPLVDIGFVSRGGPEEEPRSLLESGSG